MSQAYRLTQRAEADVEAVADFIAADSIDAAVKVMLALEDAFVLLASRPAALPVVSLAGMGCATDFEHEMESCMGARAVRSAGFVLPT